VPAAEVTAQSFTLETEVYRVVFSNRGGVVTSLQLKDYKNLDGSPVEMVFSKDTGRYPFSIHFGDADAPPVNELQFERSSWATRSASTAPSSPLPGFPSSCARPTSSSRATT
jgi:hypothetical protein